MADGLLKFRVCKEMNIPRLSLRQLYICREGTVHRNADIIALSVGPCRESSSSKQCSERQVLCR